VSVALCSRDDCDLEAPNGRLCNQHHRQLERDLAEVPALVAELETTRTRQARITTTGSGKRDKGEDQPMPINWNGTISHDALIGTLLSWVRVIVETDQLDGPDETPHAMAAWLLTHIGWTRTHPLAGQLADEIGFAVAEVRRTIDRPADRIYAGPCWADVNGQQCGTDLYGKPAARVITCPVCGTDYDVTARRDWLLAAVDDMLMAAPEIARALPDLLGYPLTPSVIRQMVFRRQIVAHGLDWQGRQTYRVGDVVAVITERAARQAKKPGGNRRGREVVA
jgi:hypothetical protein